MLTVCATSDSSLPLFAAILRCMSQFAVSSATLWLCTRSLLCSCSLFARGIFARLRLSLSCGFVFRLLYVAIPFFALPKCARLTPHAWLPGKCGAECGRVCIIRENGNNVSCETMENKSRSGGNRASCPCFGTKIGLGARFLVLMFVCLRCYWLSRRSSAKIRLRGADRAM